MRRRAVATLIAIVGIAIAVFAFAPVIYSPIKVYYCSYPDSNNLVNNGCEVPLFSAYESPSCAVLGIGTGMGNVTSAHTASPSSSATSPPQPFPVEEWSLYLGCPPKATHAS